MDRHFILTLGRSGSNALVDVINQHPAALNYGELLGDWNTIRKWQRRLRLWAGQDDTVYLDHLLALGAPLRVINGLRSARKRAAGKGGEAQKLSALKTIGAKDFTNLFAADPALRRYFLDRPDIKVIGLTRDDTIARFVSWQLLDQTGTVKQAIGEKTKAARITLNTDTLLADITSVADEGAALDAMLSVLPAAQVMRIRYEDYFFDTDVMQETTQAMFAFLGLPPHPANIRARKINTARLRDTIVNYDDCLAALDGTPFQDGFHAAG